MYRLHLQLVYRMESLKITMSYSNISRVIVYPILFIMMIENILYFFNFYKSLIFDIINCTVHPKQCGKKTRWRPF